MDVIKIILRHKTSSNPALVGDYHNSIKDIRKVPQSIFHSGQKFKLLPATHIIIVNFFIQHSVAVEKKCPGFVDLQIVEVHWRKVGDNFWVERVEVVERVDIVEIVWFGGYFINPRSCPLLTAHYKRVEKVEKI